jgi:hypothetical protein
MGESATGNQAVKTDAGLTYNAGTGVLTATGFSGPLTGNVTGDASGSSGSCTGNAATASAAAAQAITDNAIVTVDAADVADNDYAKFTANGVEGKSYSEVLSDIGAQAADADLTTWAGITPGSNVGTFLATPSSANLAAAVTDETGTGVLVLATGATKHINATPDAMSDDNYNGIDITGINFGETVAQWSCVFLASDGKVDIADADAAGEFPAMGIVVAGGDDTDAATILIQGVVRNEGWSGLTVGGAVYLGDAGTGAITQTAPSTSGDCVQLIGRAISDSEIYFNFTGHWLEVE